jgi:hypothetical protein
LEIFLEFCSNGRIADSFNLFLQNNRNLEKLHFNLMDSGQKGVVGWWDFALFYSCKLIARKNKVNILYKITFFILFFF